MPFSTAWTPALNVPAEQAEGVTQVLCEGHELTFATEAEAKANARKVLIGLLHTEVTRLRRRKLDEEADATTLPVLTIT